MDPNTQVLFEFLPFVRIYRSGRYERPVVIHDRVPPSLDPATGVASKDAVIDPETSVWARLYLPTLSGQDPKKKLPLLVYFHGGGFFIGSAGSPFYHSYINSLTAKAKAIVVSVEYRLAPEHPLPAAYDDSWVALRWVASHAEGSGPAEWLNFNADFDRVFLAGESAGANIAHNVAIRAGEAGLGHGVRVEGLALVHPYFWGAQRLESEHGNVRGRYLNPGILDAQWPAICPGAKDNDDPRVNPLAEGAPSLARLKCARALVCVAEKDVLRERGKAYYEALKGSGWGGVAEFMETEGEDHGFHFFKPDIEKAKALMDCLVAFITGD